MLSIERSSYVGDWLHNKRHGMGEFRRFDGATYVGPWVDDKMSGDGGVFTYGKQNNKTLFCLSIQVRILIL